MTVIEKDFQQAIEQSFLTYAQYVALERALPDARDMLKQSARQILYAQLEEKLTYDKPFKKAQKTVAAALSLAYTHGDQSAYGVAIRMAKPFAMRYPLEEAQGAYGNPAAANNESASRYVEMRSNELAAELTKGLNEEAVNGNKWVSNYDDTAKIPTVFPSIGFYNIVNGASGIGVSTVCSIPQFNLREVNNALITLINNPEASFEELYCPPDFATGGILINEEEVKQSLKVGEGKSCVLQAKIVYNESKRALEVIELPYGVYTNVVCKQIEQIVEDNPDCGIERLIDATTDKPCIRIYLSKKANPQWVISLLYRSTSLQYHYGIHMMMLDKGAVPRIFSWKEALQAHIDHIVECQKNILSFNKNRINRRLEILNGLLIAIAHIDEIIAIIRQQSSVSEAKLALMKTFQFSDLQAKEILDIRLQKLVKLEYIEIEKEKQALSQELDTINTLLSDREKFNALLVSSIEQTTKKFGDERRTKLLQYEERMIVNQDVTLYVVNNTVSTTRQKGIELMYEGQTEDSLLLFTEKGNVFPAEAKDFLFETKKLMITEGEKIVAVVNRDTPASFLVFITANGYIKKSSIEEYSITRKCSALKLGENDKLVEVMPVTNEQVLIGTKQGKGLRIETTTITPTGRQSLGVIALKLAEGDSVATATTIDENTVGICSITTKGFIKLSPIEIFPLTNRANKGFVLHKVKDGDTLKKIQSVKSAQKEITICTKGGNSLLVRLADLSNHGNKVGKKAAQEEVTSIFLR